MVQFDVKRVQKGAESFMVSFDFTKTPITQIADYIIIAASKHGTSDIHFDPREDGMMVRFRIDGDCQDYTFIPKAYERNLTTRLKLLANMNITESRLPQDGAIKGTFGDTYLDMRVSCLPLNEGEKIVIRILDYTRSLQGVETLGFHPKNLEKLKRMMMVPNGIILTTGATGSGKSTTTYSILQELNKPETNVITVEDPIEMSIQGINQVQVNAEIGMTFAAALRSILRQDPNVILIGEIRDSETAQIAVRAAITGHLVLSTIHTNNSLATIERLLDMDVERYLLSTALAGIISQRLAKKLCPKCRFQRETTLYEKKVFKQFMKMDVKTVWDANPKGCEECRNGYHGRIAIHEVLELDDDIRNALNNPKLEKEELAKMVYTEKTITMLQDALIKALNGETTFEEVYRVIEIELIKSDEDEDDNEDGMNYEEQIKKVVSEVAPKTEEEEETDSDDLLETPKKKEETPLVALQTNPILEEQKKQKELAEKAALAKQELDKAVKNTQAAVPAINPGQAPVTGVQIQQAVQPAKPVKPETIAVASAVAGTPIDTTGPAVPKQQPITPTTPITPAVQPVVTKQQPITPTAPITPAVPKQSITPTPAAQQNIKSVVPVIPAVNNNQVIQTQIPKTVEQVTPLVPKVNVQIPAQNTNVTKQVTPVTQTQDIKKEPIIPVVPTTQVNATPIVPTVTLPSTNQITPGNIPQQVKAPTPNTTVPEVKIKEENKIAPVTPPQQVNQTPLIPNIIKGSSNTKPITPTVNTEVKKLDSTNEVKSTPLVIPSFK